ncbi:MAG: CPBP family intramembrane metalloprotease [Acidobacteriota bacterium]|nr:CPBP family intramembrane metalloprotease [Acidobacteriota bacterium]
MRPDEVSERRRVRWTGVCVYFVVAVLVSTPFRFAMWAWYRNLELPFHLTIFKYMLVGLGPVLGAAVAWRFFPAEQRTVTLLGTSRRRSVLAAASALVAFAAIGADNPYGYERHVFGLLLSFEVLLYCVCEEIGWRGYLQDALSPLSEAAQALTIGAMWFLWHMTLIRPGFQLRGDGIFLAALMFGAWGLGRTVRATGSIVVAACLHFVLNVLLFDGLVRGIPTRQRLVGCGITLAVSVWMMVTWPADRGEV